MEVIEYKLTFTYEIDDYLKWFDDFECDEEWKVIRIKDLKCIQKSFMDKIPSYETKKGYKIALYNKNRWIYLNEGKGNAIINSKEELDIPNIKIIEYEKEPILKIYNFKYDFHVLITILQKLENVSILEYKKISLYEAKIIFDDLKIVINGRYIIYRGSKQKEFDKICKDITNTYNNQKQKIEELFNQLDKQDTNPSKTHKALAFKTWYNAKRENQREWPLISEKPHKNSIEFPKKSGIYYSYPNMYVGLAKRKDMNEELYIPKIYNTDHSKRKETILYKYMNNENINIRRIPKSVKEGDYKNLKFIKELEKEKYLEMDYKGTIIESHKRASVLVYRNMIIKNINFEEKEDFDCQILDKNNRRELILKEGKWVENKGPRIIGIPALPYNYKMIIHDYKKLNRLEKGEYMDLTHIGIVNKKDDTKITYPETNIEYYSRALETRRNMTFKYIKNNKITILYDK